MTKILIVDDKPSMRKMLKTNLELEGYQIVVANSVAKAKMLLDPTVDLIISDLKMKNLTGIDFLKSIREEDYNVPFILMTAYAKVKDAINAMKLGATEFLEKPFEIDDLLYLIKKNLKLYAYERENVVLKAFTARSNEKITIVGNSSELKRTIKIVEKVAKTTSAVLLTGESGTGKEVFAKYLHYQSDRKEYPFVAINCAAIPSELMEAELFGYEKGAFTGADSQKIGLFEIAKNGTIFLDEIGELPFNMQSKLLRVIQEKEFLRVGGVKAIKTDVRLVTATNQNLEELIERKEFREDLYFRISVIPIHIPALRDRKDDIPLLVEYFIEKFSKEMNIPKLIVSDRAQEILYEFDYKGNIRQLRNIIERAVILAENNVITSDVLGIKPKIGIDSLESFLKKEEFDETTPLGKVTEKAIRYSESRHILKVLKAQHWNRTKATKILGISYKTLLTKIKDYNLNPNN